MADTFPLQKIQTQYTGKSPSAVTDQAEAYKNMLGFQAAGEDVGLFYQLNQIAAVPPVEVETYTNSNSRQLQNIKRYGNYAEPIEAGGVYA
jgi:hypothetical protein